MKEITNTDTFIEVTDPESDSEIQLIWLASDLGEGNGVTLSICNYIKHTDKML